MHQQKKQQLKAERRSLLCMLRVNCPLLVDSVTQHKEHKKLVLWSNNSSNNGPEKWKQLGYKKTVSYYIGLDSTLDAATYPRRVANTGVLHGDAAKANVRPAR